MQGEYFNEFQKLGEEKKVSLIKMDQSEPMFICRMLILSLPM